MHISRFFFISISLFFLSGCAAPRPDGAPPAPPVSTDNLEKLNQGRASLQKWKDAHGDSYVYVVQYNPQPSSKFVTRLVTVQNGHVVSEKSCITEYNHPALVTEEKDLKNTFTLDQEYHRCEKVHLPKAVAAGHSVDFEFSKDGLLLSCTYSSGPDCVDCGRSGFRITAVVPFNKNVSQQSACYQNEIHFDRHSTRLSEAAKTELREIAQVLKHRPIHYQIEGHTDQVGSIEANLVIAEKRAATVKAFLVREGADPSRLTIVSFGKEKPQWDPQKDDKNRRVVIVPIY